MQLEVKNILNTSNLEEPRNQNQNNNDHLINISYIDTFKQ